MVRLDLSYFYRLGQAFPPLRAMPESGRIGDVWADLWAAREAIRALYNDDTVKHGLRSSRDSATKFFELLDGYTDREWESDFSKFDKAAIVSRLETFEAILQSDLAIADSYFVTDKAPYNAESLIENGATLFPSGTAGKVPLAIKDLDNAGKCLAFELSTATGFHIMRALEAVLRAYWESVTNGAAHPPQRNIGVYLGEMDKRGVGDAKIIAALRQIKDLHRNEISHPDAHLTYQEALSLIGIAQSAAAAMLTVIPEPPFELTPLEAEPALLGGNA